MYLTKNLQYNIALRYHTAVPMFLGVGADPTLRDSSGWFLPQKSVMIFLSISFTHSYFFQCYTSGYAPRAVNSNWSSFGIRFLYLLFPSNFPS